MAEKKVIVFICDRDGFEHKRLRGHKLPAGWLTIQGKDLCPKCVGELDKFLEGAQVIETYTPEVTDTTVVARNVDGSPSLVSVSPVVDALNNYRPHIGDYRFG